MVMMDGPKLNEECCFSCLQVFEAARSEINIGENKEAIKRVLDINFSSDCYDETMNLCISCNNNFKEAKEEFLKLRELESLFNAKRKKFAFTIVESIVKDDYLGTSIENSFFNLRAKIYTKWQKDYKNRVEIMDENIVSSPIKTEEKDAEIQKPIQPKPNIILKRTSAQTTPVFTNAMSLQGIKKEIVTPEAANKISFANQNATTAATTQPQRKVIFVKRDPMTGQVYQVNPVGGAGNIKYRLNNASLNAASPIRFAPRPPTQQLFPGKPNMVPVAANGVAKLPVPLPKSRMIVRSPMVMSTSSKIVVNPPAAATVKIPVLQAELHSRTTRVPSGDSPSDEDSKTEANPEKKSLKRKSSIPQLEPVNFPQVVSNRSRRIIKKPIDSSCLYGSEYEHAVKYSSRDRSSGGGRTKLTKRISDPSIEYPEDSYRIDVGEDENEFDQEGSCDIDDEIENDSGEKAEEV